MITVQIYSPGQNKTDVLIKLGEYNTNCEENKPAGARFWDVADMLAVEK